MEELDIWRTATLLITQHGEDAVFEAALRADGLFAKNDFLGAAVWHRIGPAPRLKSLNAGSRARARG